MSKVFKFDAEHPEYQAKQGMWRLYRDLYAGGGQFKRHAGEYLVKRHREPLDIYGERLSRVFYENYLGSIIDWYAATLFRREPLLSYEGTNDRARTFYNEFAEDCDQRGTSITDFFRKQLTTALVCGSSYILVDFPRFPGRAANRAEEEAAGGGRAYLVGYSPAEVVNCSEDERGNWEWIVVRTKNLRRKGSEGSVWATETRWTYYDKERYRSYRLLEGSDDKGTAPQLIDEGRHGLADLKRVPMFELRVSEGLWLANKAGLLQLEHFNKSNALAWALTMGLFASPVVYTDREWNQIVGESYYIQLGPEDKFGWTEPEGRVFQIAAENLERLKNEIYRVCYLLTQAGGAFSGSAPQSGLSKQRDFTITQEVLRAYGDTVKDTMKRILRAIEAARGDGLKIDVSGLDEFDIGDFSSELEDAVKLLGLGTGSMTLKKQVIKKLSLKYLCDVRQEVKDQISREIDEWCESNAQAPPLR